MARFYPDDEPREIVWYFADHDAKFYPHDHCFLPLTHYRDQKVWSEGQGEIKGTPIKYYKGGKPFGGMHGDHWHGTEQEFLGLGTKPSAEELSSGAILPLACKNPTKITVLVGSFPHDPPTEITVTTDGGVVESYSPPGKSGKARAYSRTSTAGRRKYEGKPRHRVSSNTTTAGSTLTSATARLLVSSNTTTSASSSSSSGGRVLVSSNTTTSASSSSLSGGRVLVSSNTTTSASSSSSSGGRVLVSSNTTTSASSSSSSGGRMLVSSNTTTSGETGNGPLFGVLVSSNTTTSGETGNGPLFGVLVTSNTTTFGVPPEPPGGPEL